MSTDEPQFGSSGGEWGEDAVPAETAASVGKRVGAYLLDVIGVTIIVYIVLLLTGLAQSMMDPTATGQAYVSNLLAAVLTLAYFVLLEAGSGQTLAKRLLGIKAVMADGSPLTTEAALKRRFWFMLGAVIPTALGSLIGIVIVLVILITAIQDQPLHQGFHDRFASTKVIEAS